MDFPNVFKTRIAAPKKQLFDLSCNHLTTMDFGSFLPVYYRHLIPGDKISVNASCFSRLSPLVFPTLGDVKIETRAFWIPYREVNESWQDFISNKLNYYSPDGTNTTPRIPFFKNDTVVAFLYHDANGTANQYASLASDTGSADLVITYNGASVNVKLNDRGNFFVNTLQSLGYEINWNNSDKTQLNALALLAFCKVFIDWYVNPNYDWSFISRFFKGNDRELLENDFSEIFQYFPYVNYKPDYFTAAQRSTLINNTVQNGAFQVNDASPVYGINDEGHPSIVSSKDSVQGLRAPIGSTANLQSSAQLSLTNYGISLIQRLSDFLKRNNLAGSRYVDQMLVRFGTRPTDDIAGRSSYLGSLITNVQMSDVMQTSVDSGATDGVGVGNYTGKGIAFDTGNWNFECNEHGLFLVVATIRPRTQYYQGRDRHNLHLDQLDFFTPEFDGVNLQAIRLDELYSCFQGAEYPSTGTYKPSAVFGFSPRYAEYKISKDWLTGDFRRRVFRNTMRGFHLFRELSPTQGINSRAGYHFETLTSEDRINYDRIFQTPGTTEIPYDHFIVNFVFDVKLTSSIMSISESLLPDEGNKEIDVRPFGMYF